jgi:hypothetical protein
MACKKPVAKPVKVKDVGTKKNPRGGMNKGERPTSLAAPRLASTMQDAVSGKLAK